ncbi:DMT family transporter [Maridesulfovibrio bastinii]|uniref:DMT family transporter n=1 Tax=Maridesulfovibrio bastinii TaxID=47157 RepID=UPI00040A57F5|nr:DMT family transporter [Maridesulfovibrio bastinii]
MKNQNKAYLFGISAVLIWSTVASAFKISLTYLNPIQLLLYASAASLLALFAIIMSQGKLNLILKTNKKDVLICSLLGVLNPFIYYIILFKAYDLLPAQEAQSLNYTWAITLSILSIPLLKQKMSLKELLAIMVCYLGVLVISTKGEITKMEFANTTGVVFALLSTLIWSLYWIYNTKSKADPIVGLFISFCAALPLIFISTLIWSELPPVNLKAIAGACYVGLFEMGITFVLWLNALKLTEKASRVSNLIFLSPFISLILIHFIVGEKILVSTIIGLMLIIAGNVIQILGKKSKKAY